MKMDCNSPDRSPPLSENNGGSWGECWDTEDTSLSALNLEHSRELQNLVEDKEIAARAVAFVVSSTRKGIVPLCADVASLLRVKSSLEKKVIRLKGQNETLRNSQSGSVRTSDPESPTPASLHSCSERGSFHEHSGHLHEGYSPYYSRSSSQSSSLISNSPKFDKTHHHRSPRLHRTSAFKCVSTRAGDRAQEVTLALVQPPPNGLHEVTLHESSPTTHRTKLRRHHRKNSLPEMVSEPNDSVPKINPKVNTAMVGIQCSLDGASHGDQKLPEQFKQTLQINSRLAEELGAAKKEIEVLKGRLRELEMNQVARESTDRFFMENECCETQPNYYCDGRSTSTSANSPVDPRGRSERIDTCNSHPLPDRTDRHTSQIVATDRMDTRTSQLVHKNRFLGTKRQSTPSPILSNGPLEGCLCSPCLSETGGAVTIKLDTLLQTENNSAKQRVGLGDRVVVKGEKTGCVRYIGHMDSVGQASTVFAGLELEAPVGTHNGMLNGKRYFTCEKDCGIFVPLHHIICKIVTNRNLPHSCHSTVDGLQGTKRPVALTLDTTGRQATNGKDKLSNHSESDKFARDEEHGQLV